MSRALLITSFPAGHIEEKFVPGFAARGWHVIRVATPRFAGPIEGVDALFMIEQMTSESERRGFRARCHQARVTFVVLPSERARWGDLIPDPKPAAPEPAAPPAPPPPRPPVDAPAPAAPRMPPQPPPPLPRPPMPPPRSTPVVPAAAAPPPTKPDVTGAPAATEPITYGAWLRSQRGDTSAVEVGKILGVSDSLVVGWEREQCGIAHDHLASLTALYGEAPEHVLPPKAPLRARHAPRPTSLPVAAPIELPTPYSNGHVAIAPLASLKGLRKAARALRIAGDVVVTGRDDGATVTIGDESWPGADEDEAVATARRDLDGRLRALRSQLEEAITSLGGVA